MVRLRDVLFAALLASLPVQAGIAQTRPQIKQQAQIANCSNVVVLGGTATFRCTGLTPDQAKMLKGSTAIPELIARLLETSQAQYLDITAKLNQLLQNELSESNPSGDLKERTVALAASIMESLYERGWMGGKAKLRDPEMFLYPEPGPRDPEAVQLAWFKHVRDYFNAEFTAKVLGIHQEFADLHRHDQKLDEFVQRFRKNSSDQFPINAWDVTDVAQSLCKLARELPPNDERLDKLACPQL